MFQFPGCPPRKLWIHLRVSRHCPGRVPPFGYPRIVACLQLPVAFRSWPRPSSAVGALASTLCSSSLDYSPETNVSVFLSFTYFDWSFDSLFFPLQLSRCAVNFFTFQGKSLVVGRSGLEPPTSRLSGECSNRLSYQPMKWRISGSNR